MKTAFKFLVFSILMLTNFSIDAKEYKGAEYRTKEAFLYGRFEVNLKTSYREGMLSSFFTYNDAGGGWNEIDIEILGRYTNDFQMNPITPGQVNHVGHHLMSSSPHADFHTYAFEWTPEYVSWFVDGVEVLRQTGAHIQTLNLPQKIMMNVWIPQYENWVGIFSRMFYLHFHIMIGLVITHIHQVPAVMVLVIIFLMAGQMNLLNGIQQDGIKLLIRFLVMIAILYKKMLCLMMVN